MIKKSSVLAMLLVCLCWPATEARAAGGQAVLTLVTEHVQSSEQRAPTRRYWWSTPTQPEWTETDRALRAALREAGVRMIRPDDDVRISSIYRRPDLSVDNAAALASIVGANRVLAGRITLDRTLDSPLWGVEAVGLRADLQLIDTSGSEPAILRHFQLERQLFRAPEDRSILEKARRAVARRTATLLNRTLVASSGPIGPIDPREPGLALHGVTRSAALDTLRSHLLKSEFVDDVAIAWATDGMIVLEINPDARDGDALVRRAGRVIESVDVPGLRVRRRDDSPPGTLGWDVTVTSKFSQPMDASSR